MGNVVLIRQILLSIALMLFASAGSYAQTADELGRLFSTPRERMELDQIRSIWLQDNGEEDVALDIELDVEVTPPPPPANLYLRLEGTVRQADGSHTVWINGEALPQRLLPENIRLAQVGDLIVLWVSYLDKLFIVRPGQVLHFASEAVYEQYLLPPAIAQLIAPSTAQSPAVSELVTDSAAADTPGLPQDISNIADTLNQVQELNE